MARIDVERLSVVYPGTDSPVVALRELDICVEDGEPVAVIGPSGCGKSTLLLCIAGLVPPSSGGVRIDGAPVTGPRRRSALMLQDFGLLPWKTVEHNVALGLEIRGVDPRTRRGLCSVPSSSLRILYPKQSSCPCSWCCSASGMHRKWRSSR